MWAYRVMELKAITPGERLARYPYGQAVILSTRTEVSGDHHEYSIPFSQLLVIHCKRGLVWDELKFVLPDGKVVRLYGAEQGETQRFYYYLGAYWRRWNSEMSEIASGVLHQQLDLIAARTGENRWPTREQTSSVQQQIRQALSALPLPVNRPEEFNNCREAWRKYQTWLKDIEGTWSQHNQVHTKTTLIKYANFLRQVESSPLSPTQARAAVNGEHPLLVPVDAGSGETSVLVTRAGWLLARDGASSEQILLLVFGRKAAEEMHECIRERLHTKGTTAHTFHALALHTIQWGSKRILIVSKSENDTVARHELSTVEWCKQCSEKEAQAKGWR